MYWRILLMLAAATATPLRAEDRPAQAGDFIEVFQGLFGEGFGGFLLGLAAGGQHQGQCQGGDEGRAAGHGVLQVSRPRWRALQPIKRASWAFKDRPSPRR